ncbi:MAG: hypothetical protein ACUVS7_19640, partial [Bryobacteraceae bacterium]
MAESRAREPGNRALALSTFIEGETREITGTHAAVFKGLRVSTLPKGSARVTPSGESTRMIHGEGLGGCNRGFACAPALDAAGLRN